MSFLGIRDPARKKGEKPRVTSHNAKGMVPWGTRTRSYEKKEVVAKNFRTSKVRFCLPRKNDKNEGRPKGES